MNRSFNGFAYSFGYLLKIQDFDAHTDVRSTTSRMNECMVFRTMLFTLLSLQQQNSKTLQNVILCIYLFIF